MKVHLCIPPHKLTKMVFFMQLGIMKHRVSVSEKWPHFQKWQNYIHFNCNFTKSQKTILRLQKFFEFLPWEFCLFSCYTEEILWFVKNGIFTNHRETSGVKSFLPWERVFALRRPEICPETPWKFLSNHSKTSGVREMKLTWGQNVPWEAFLPWVRKSSVCGKSGYFFMIICKKLT